MGLMLKPPPNTPGKAWPAIIIGLFVAFGGVLFGYDTGTISGIIAMDYWKKSFSTQPDFSITASEDSLIVSILSAGTFFGALTAAPFGDFFGRRYGLMISAGFVFNLGVILQTISTRQPLFIAGRFFAGYGVGLVSALIPMYQSETSPKWIRGTIVGAYQLAITIGLFLASIVNNATKDRDDSGSYRIPIAVQFAWSIILVVGLIFLPETPRYLIKTDRYDDAAKALGKLRRLPIDHPAVLEELNEVQANHLYEMSLGKSTYIDCFKGTLGKRLITGCLLQSLQQLTGVNFIFYYGTQYFQRAGFKNPFTIQVITNCVNVASTFPGLYAVERLGRRNLLLLGAIGMCFCQYIVAIVGTVSGTTDLPAQRTAIAFVCIYIFFFASSWGPVAWVVTGELYPLKARAKCLSMTTASNWLLNWAIAYSTPYMVDAKHANLQSKVFFIWATFCFVCIAFVWFMIYETKGLSLEQVDELYGVVTQAWKSKSFRPTVTFADIDQNAGRGMSLTEVAQNQERKRSVQHDESVVATETQEAKY
ncbi:AraJ Arabinose efflux permease [Pyrenophora tritici-repentis]|uniref:AraJ, Arabinose efflux permease n=2 Tax=Pyrenophora tritici-repentis TaxID=45151 RepID=A0A2W1FDA1_9PLEO|nr:high affinity glucose transporter RGT2 [Pyrenophora tritici-repentis Pt-1C-BFP]KAA8625866.1 High affinity glucose transporter RGT2 [Pyrenophora tritici-repentis]EDU40664.1 high affinity glucose transporter RGT2 [Pyrenophora tritici-repentis Pt-1C-BFP]KAF7454284.1 High affinity glucose transporter RGT2 [Pyrenophora tritici-repentis]KAF7577383.1 AraJ, Arabinose efflux permease [Pyrenophora tritici-repentis]KAI0584848.1 High affinity glucose transporter RGT2 [Pyrenophora tritici-repentis]